MKVKALAPWFGGKRSMAPAVAAELGPHKQYFEPFCGSMAVLFAKDRAGHETVNDLHGDITNLARVVADPQKSSELSGRLELTLFSEALFSESHDYLQQPIANCDTLTRAYWFLLESWMGRNGVTGTQRVRGNGFSLAVRWTPGGGSPTKRFRSMIESIPDWHTRLQNVVILNRDAFEIIPRVEDKPHSAIYVDPPYLSETRSGFSGSGGHSRYEHEFSNGGSDLFGGGDDHLRLAEMLRSFKEARVVLSYYWHPRLEEMYDGWTVVRHSRQKNLAVQNARGRKRETAEEVLILNGPSYAAEK